MSEVSVCILFIIQSTRLLPLISLAAHDLTVEINTGQIASDDSIIIDPLLLPLWGGDVQVKEIQIDGARLSFNRHAIDKFMALARKEADTSQPLASLAIDSFAIANGGFKYTDGKTLLDFNDINFRGDRIEIIKNRQVVIEDVFQFLKAVSFKGKVTARQITSYEEIQLELLADFLSQAGKPSASKALPIRSVWVNNFTSAATDLNYPPALGISPHHKVLYIEIFSNSQPANWELLGLYGDAK